MVFRSQIADYIAKSKQKEMEKHRKTGCRLKQIDASAKQAKPEKKTGNAHTVPEKCPLDP